MGWGDIFGLHQGIFLGAAWKEMAQQHRRITDKGENLSFRLVLGCVKNRIRIR